MGTCVPPAAKGGRWLMAFDIDEERKDFRAS